MAELNQNGIKFNISNDPIYIYGMDKVSNSANVGADGNYNATKVASKGKSTPVVNGIDIDWNGATLSYVNQPGVLDASNQVNTTGQLLALINDLQSRLSA